MSLLNTRRSLVVAALSLPLGANAASEDSQWRFSAGAGVLTIPEYPGSDEQRAWIFPAISATRGRLFLGTDADIPSPGGVGVDLYRQRGWRLGVAAYADPTRRRESDDERLTGLGDVDRAVRAGIFGSYTTEHFVLRASTGTDVSGNDQGTLLRVDALGRWRPSERLILSAGPGVTWADSEHTRTFFGVDAGQAQRSGLPEYQASSGINSVRLSIGANYRLAERWSLGAFLTASRLQGDAADSPITQDKSQTFAGAVATYRF